MRAQIKELIGKEIGPYRLTAYIGAGVNGTVFRAEHSQRPGLSYAVKLFSAAILSPADHDTLSERAARAATVKNAHVTPLLDWGTSELGWYCVTAFVAGPEDASLNLQNYWHRLDHQRVPSGQVFQWAMQIGEALQSIHKKDLIHGHLSPGNVLFDAKGNAHLGEPALAPDAVVKQVVDQLRDSLQPGSKSSGETTAIGTKSLRKNAQALRAYYYLAPEQRQTSCIGSDPRSDIYAFGMLLFRMLTGVYPRHDRQKPSLLVSDLQEEWDDIILACLDSAAAKRPGSIGLICKELRSRFRPVKPWSPRLVTLLVLLSATMVGVAISQFVLNRLSPLAPPQAERLVVESSADNPELPSRDPTIPIIDRDQNEALYRSYVNSGKQAFAEARWEDARSAFTSAQAVPGHDAEDWLLQLYLARIQGAESAENVLWKNRAQQHAQSILRELGAVISTTSAALPTLTSGAAPMRCELLALDVQCHLELARLRDLQRQEVWRHFPNTSAAALGGMEAQLRPLHAQVRAKLGADSQVPLAGINWTVPELDMAFVWLAPMRCWVGQYEVTNAQYRHFQAGHSSGKSGDYSLNDDRQPVVQVNYIDADEFAKWLSKREQLMGRLPQGWQYRLPSGEQWDEFASCGDGRVFPWGNDRFPPEDFNYKGEESSSDWGVIRGHNDNFVVAAPVEASGGNTWGIFGVGGNVWEWSSEGFISKKPRGWYQVVRGGSWYENELRGLTCGYRRTVLAGSRRSVIGFRLVLAPAAELQANPAVKPTAAAAPAP